MKAITLSLWFIVIQDILSIELEDEKVICDGREGCWTLRDNKKIESFAVLHNGSKSLSEQIITFNFKLQ